MIQNEMKNNDFELNGSDEAKNVQNRIDFLRNALNNAETKINHIDGMRQKNLNFALILFAGLYGLGLKFSDKISSPFILSTIVVLLMLIFCLIDRRLHRLSHGWRSTGKLRVKSISQTTNKPDTNLNYPSYDRNGMKKAELFSLQPVVFYILIICGIFSFWLF